MTKFRTIILFLLLFQVSFSQEITQRFEVGTSLLTANFYCNDPFTSSVNYFNGLLLRYTKNDRFTARFHVYYSNNYNEYLKTSIVTWPYSELGTTYSSKDFRVGLGGQFIIFKKWNWLYAYLDSYYRNVYSISYIYGPIPEKKIITSDGADFNLGFGFIFSLNKIIEVSPEIGCYSSSQFVNSTSTFIYSSNFGEQYINDYTATYLYPMLKINLNAKF